MGHPAAAMAPLVLVLVALALDVAVIVGFVLVLVCLIEEICCRCVYLCTLFHIWMDHCLIFELVLSLNILVQSGVSI